MSDSLWSLFETALSGAVFTDLTHAFHPGQPHFPKFPDEQSDTFFDYSKGHGVQVHHYGIVGQWGTHVDPPVHFIEGGRTLDQIPVSDMLLRLVVLDITARVADDPDATPTQQDIADWEARNGRIPEQSFVALRTGWSRRWPDVDAFANRTPEGVSHCPGWSQEALSLLIEARNVTAVGHEQVDTDPGVATSAGDHSLERYILAQDRWQIELLANLDGLPESGALIMASWPKPLRGSGFPARAVAISR
jgi:kynurenine formamidase